jgi:hypothetical protein
MAFPASKMLRVIPYGVCDCVDGTNAKPGAMAELVNLVPDPSTHGVWVPRPAAVSTVGFPNPAFISGLVVIGDLAYGMIATSLFAGKDIPFCFNLATQTAISIFGVTSGNVPTSPPVSGAWTPPTLAQVGGRVIVTHPGFPGGATKFGWLDVSGFSETTTGDTTNASVFITGNPLILGVQPGMTISGTDIPVGTTVVSTLAVTLVGPGDTHSNTTIDNLPVLAGTPRAVGQTVAGAGIPLGTTVATIVSPTSVTISNAATATAAGVSLTFGGAVITLSQAMTGTHTGVTLTIVGGTRAAPLWGAGDTDINPLIAIPVGVAQFNGRAYYALGFGGVAYSDSGFACRISNSIAVQALTTNDGLPVTAIGPLLLSAPLTGGIVQALIAFEGATKMQQITGDQAIPATSTAISAGGQSTLAMNALPVATGTLAPLSICPTEHGLAFVSPQGLRFVQFDGSVSKPIGNAGAGVTVPFAFTVQPSRICASANDNVIRITTQNGSGPIQPQEEYWYDMTRAVWSGPHTSAASLIQPWRSTFLMTFIGSNAHLFQSDAKPGPTSTYIENNAQLSWAARTALLPDGGDGSMQSLIEMSWACELATATSAVLAAVSDYGFLLDTATVTGDGMLTIWNQFNWNQALWNAQGSAFRQRSVDWHAPLVFRQAAMAITGISAFNVRIGNIYMKHQTLGYKIEEAA